MLQPLTLLLLLPAMQMVILGGVVAYGLLALHCNKVGNVNGAAASPGAFDALLPPLPVTQEITATANISAAAAANADGHWVVWLPTAC